MVYKSTPQSEWYRATCTVWKVPKYEVFPGPYVPVFGLNTETYYVNLRIQSECRKIRTRKSSVFGHFSRSVVQVSWKNFEKDGKSFGTVLKMWRRNTCGKTGFLEILQVAIKQSAEGTLEVFGKSLKMNTFLDEVHFIVNPYSFHLFLVPQANPSPRQVIWPPKFPRPLDTSTIALVWLDFSLSLSEEKILEFDKLGKSEFNNQRIKEYRAFKGNQKTITKQAGFALKFLETPIQVCRVSSILYFKGPFFYCPLFLWISRSPS